MKLQVAYFEDTDTLSLWNGQPASHADDVSENLIVDYNGAGEAVGFTLEHAAELLLPILASPYLDAGRPNSGDPNWASLTDSHIKALEVISAHLGRGPITVHVHPEKAKAPSD